MEVFMRAYKVIQALNQAKAEMDANGRYADSMVISSLVLWMATGEAQGDLVVYDHQVAAMNRLLEALDMRTDIIK